MLIKDSKDQFGLVSILLHWTIALAVITLLATGITAFVIGRGPLRTDLLNFHLSLASVFIPVILVRLFWRSRSGKPKLPPQHPVLEDAASAVWRLLLIGMVCQLITGPFLTWMHGHPIGIVGLYEIYSPFPKTSQADMVETYDMARLFHATIGFTMAVLVLVHVAGALKHAIIDQDGVLLRIVRPGARVTPASRPVAALPEAVALNEMPAAAP
jgi:cytochrome b561